MIDLDKRLNIIESALTMLANDQLKLVTDDELVDTRIEIFEKIEQIQIDTSAIEHQLDLLENIITDITTQQGR